MLVTGFMGSPRKGGNTSFLLKSFLAEAERFGAETRYIHVPDLTIHPCTGCSLCEKKGHCHFDDDMQKTVFPLLKNSQVIIIASPIYFYNVPAELKALIDRSQTLWARKFKLGLTDPSEKSRKGFLLSVGATRGKDLFDSINLTMKYFFKGISTDYSGQLTYPLIEDLGEIKKHPTVKTDISHAAENLLPFFTKKKTLAFICRSNSLTSQMAAAFAQHMAKGEIHVYSAGTLPGQDIHPLLVPAMAEKGLDLAYRKPMGIPSLFKGTRPDHVVIMGDPDDTALFVPGASLSFWEIPDPQAPSPETVARLRDQIEQRVSGLIKEMINS